MPSISRPLALAALLGALGTAPAARATECVATSPGEAQAAVEDARRAVLTLEYEPTLNKLKEVRKSLECLTGTVPTDSLGLLYFYQGLMYALLEQPEPAMDAFRDAAAIVPLLQEDREQSTQIREMWAKARDEVTASPGTLVVPDLPKEAVAYIDGKPLEAEVSSMTVYPGVHLLQVWGDDRQLHGTLMRVRPGETTVAPAEFLASLTPRGELVLNVSPRGSKVVIRQGNKTAYEWARLPRRVVVPDVKEGAYFVEVRKPGYYEWSQGKVAVEGGDQTHLDVDLKRRPSLGIVTRGSVFWVSSADGDDVDPMVSTDLVGRLSSGWGFHAEYLHHIPSSGALFGEDEEPYPVTEIPNDDLADGVDTDEDGIIDTPHPVAFYPVTDADLPLGARLYLGVSRQFRIEVVDVSVGAKLALHGRRASGFGEVTLGWNPLPWVGVDARVGVGPMIRVSDEIYDKYEDETMFDYVRFGLIGMAGAGIRVGF